MKQVIISVTVSLDNRDYCNGVMGRQCDIGEMLHLVFGLNPLTVAVGFLERGATVTGDTDEAVLLCHTFGEMLNDLRALRGR